MKKLLVPSLESLVEADPMTIDEIDEMIASLSDSSMIFDEDEDDGEIESYVDQIEESVERLETLANIISEYGISAPIMKLADPHNELIALKVCSDYESLSDVPVKNEEADAAIEAIGGVVKNLFKGMKNVFLKISNALKDLGIFIQKYMGDFTNSIRRGIIELKKVNDIEESKFAARNIRGFSKSNYTKAVGILEGIYKGIGSNVLSKMLGDFEALVSDKDVTPDQLKALTKKAKSDFEKLISSDVQGFLGMKMVFDTDGELSKIKSDKRFLVTQRGEVGKLGWKSGDLTEVGNKLLKIVAMYSLIYNSNKIMMDHSSKFIRVISSQGEFLSEANTESRSAKRYAFKQARMIFRVYQYLIYRSITPARELIINFLQLVKAYKTAYK